MQGSEWHLRKGQGLTSVAQWPKRLVTTVLNFPSGMLAQLMPELACHKFSELNSWSAQALATAPAFPFPLPLNLVLGEKERGSEQGRCSTSLPLQPCKNRSSKFTVHMQSTTRGCGYITPYLPYPLSPVDPFWILPGRAVFPWHEYTL